MHVWDWLVNFIQQCLKILKYFSDDLFYTFHMKFQELVGEKN